MSAAILLGAALLLLIANPLLSGSAHQPMTPVNWSSLFAYVALAVAGFVVARRQPRNAIGWILLWATLFIALSDAAGGYAAWDYRFSNGVLPLGGLAVFLQLGWAPAIVLFPLPVLLFPNGHAPSRRWRRVMWLYLVLGAIWAVSELGVAASGVIGQHIRVDPTGQLTVLDHPTGLPAVVYNIALGWTLVFVVFWLTWVTRLVTSYRRSNGERRQQLKWFLGGATLAGIGLVGLLTVGNLSRIGPVAGVVSNLALAALPIGMGVGILKYRLYDIDRLISRTLSYAIVTGLLIGLYVGLVTLATRILPFSSPLGVAVSTLAAVALFNPLRRRVQRLVDRRFNRARYDAEVTIAAFALRVREDVDLEAVSSELVRAVQSSVEPVNVALWLRPTDSRG
ncbi:MAG: hypothetical protein WBR23_02330 [Candidatus Dormiibacterota bacterium]